MDLNVHAFRLVQEATNENTSRKNKKASARKGGIKGGVARALSMSAEQRIEIARTASMARWSNREKSEQHV